MSEIINIKNVSLNGDEKFFVDSNVWFWFTYAASNEFNRSQRYQLLEYPQFVEKALERGSKLYHSPLLLSELTSVIENVEFELFNSTLENELTKKQFRKNMEQRNRVIEQVELAWNTVIQLSECLEIHLDSKLTSEALKLLKLTRLDPYDAFYMHSMHSYGISNIVTDDSDFEGLKVSLFTANNRLLQ